MTCAAPRRGVWARGILLLALAVALGAPASCASDRGGRGGMQGGNDVVELRLPRRGGGQWDLATERGNIVLINYFATWCAPCVAEWPLLVEIQKRYHSAGLRVIGVCMDAGPGAGEVLSAFIDHFAETNFPILLASERTFNGDPWAIGQLPTTIMVDRNGKPMGKWEGMLPPNETEAMVRDLVLGQAPR